MEFKPGTSCATGGSAWYELDFCANGVPYKKLVPVDDCSCPDQTVKWINLSDGSTSTTEPSNAVAGLCSDVEQDTKICYEFVSGGTTFKYTRVVAAGVATYYLDGVVITDVGELAAAKARIASATADNIVNCTPDILWADVTTAPAATGNADGPRFEILSPSEIYFIDSNGRAEKFFTGCTTRAIQETFSATAAQTAFTLTNTPVSEVMFSRNGAVISDDGRSVSGTTVTYIPSGNNGDALVANDKIVIFYTYEDCTSAVTANTVVTNLQWSGDNLVASYSNGTNQTLTTPTC